MFVLGFRCFARIRFSVFVAAKVTQFSCSTTSKHLCVKFPIWCVYVQFMILCGLGRDQDCVCLC